MPSKTRTDVFAASSGMGAIHAISSSDRIHPSSSRLDPTGQEACVVQKTGATSWPRTTVARPSLSIFSSLLVPAAFHIQPMLLSATRRRRSRAAAFGDISISRIATGRVDSRAARPRFPSRRSPSQLAQHEFAATSDERGRAAKQWRPLVRFRGQTDLESQSCRT
jgi:hypothetical protein